MTGFSFVVTTSAGNLGVYGLLALLAIIVQQYSNYDRMRDYITSAGGHNSEFYFDFVIVGSGSAGSVLANRLSRKFKVLVLEAGGQPNPLMGIPSFAFPFQTNPEIDWMYQTVPQRNACLGLIGKRSRWPRGKAEGGSSNLNAMIYLRGNPKDFDSMAATLQDPLWTYNSVQNFYKQFENFDDNNPNHGHGGEQAVETNYDHQELTDAFVLAGREQGYPIADLNSYHIDGFMPLRFTTKRGVRWEDYLAFLKPAKESPLHRLSVYKYAKVVRVLVDHTKRAYGVEYIRHGIRRRAFASKEVIVSAGAINSPQLLMLSGIGPKRHLKSLGIPLVSDLPVGQNLQDHVGSMVGMFSLDKPVTTSIFNDLSVNKLFEYLYQGTGIMSNTFVKAVASVSSKFSKRERWPDLQLSLLGVSQPPSYEPALSIFNIKPEVLRTLWDSTAGLNTFQIFIINARPKQRGEVTLVSVDPDMHPRIDPKYLQNRQDVEASVEAMQLAKKLVTTTDAFRKLGGKLLPIPLEPCRKLPFASDAYWECSLRHLTMTLYHPCCTCPMGNSTDVGSVTDSNLRVRGVRNLRVIDASSFPAIPSSNLNAPTNLVGEIGSHLICKQWSGKNCFV